MQVHRIEPKRVFTVPPIKIPPPIVYNLDYNSSNNESSYEIEYFRRMPQLLSEIAFNRKESVVFPKFQDSYRFDQSTKKPKKRNSDDEEATRWILLRKQYMDRLTELCGVYIQRYLESEDHGDETDGRDVNEDFNPVSVVHRREIEASQLIENQKTIKSRSFSKT